MGKLKTIALIGGLLLLAWLVYHTGVAALVEYLLRVGWGILILLLIAAVRHSFRSLAVRRAMGEEHARFSFPAMYGVLLISEAIKFVAFAGLLFGESAKALLLRRRVPAARAVSSVVLDVLLYYLSAALFSLIGISLLFAWYPASTSVRRVGSAGALLVACALLLASVGFARRWLTAARLFAAIARLRLVRSLSSPDWLEKRRSRFAEIDDQVFHFYQRHAAAFYGILLLNLAAHCTSAFEVMIAMRLLGLHARYVDGVAVEALTKLVELGGIIVPADVGVYQGGMGLILKTIGFSAGAGVALGIVRQLRSILWAALGFVVLPFSGERQGTGSGVNPTE